MSATADDGEAGPAADPLAAVRAACLALPGVTERASHGSPAWFVHQRRSFVMYMNNHHGDGRVALWCAAPEGVQAAMVEARPDAYFVPPYVGPRGWLGVRLDRDLAWADVAYAITDAYHAALARR